MKYLILISLVTSISTFAIPHDNVLKGVDGIQTTSSGKLLVTYTLPCKYDDGARIVMNSDDTGDLMAGVGVVYSQERRNCGVGTNTFSREVDPQTFGYQVEAVEGFRPMPVKQ